MVAWGKRDERVKRRLRAFFRIGESIGITCRVCTYQASCSYDEKNSGCMWAEYAEINGNLVTGAVVTPAFHGGLNGM